MAEDINIDDLGVPIKVQSTGSETDDLGVPLKKKDQAEPVSATVPSASFSEAVGQEKPFSMVPESGSGVPSTEKPINVKLGQQPTIEQSVVAPPPTFAEATGLPVQKIDKAEQDMANINKAIDFRLGKQAEIKTQLQQATTAYEQQVQELNNFQTQLNNPGLDVNSKNLLIQAHNELLKNTQELEGFINKSQKDLTDTAKGIVTMNRGIEFMKKPPVDKYSAPETLVRSLYNSFIPPLIGGVGSVIEATADVAEKISPSNLLLSAAGVPQITTDDKFTDQMGESLRGFSESIKAETDKASGESVFEGDLTANKIAHTAGNLLGSIAAVAGGTVLGGGVGGFATGFTLVMDQGYNSAKENGLSDTQAATFSLLTSLPIAALDLIGTGSILKSISPKILSKELTKRVLKDVGENAAPEIIANSTAKVLKEISKDIASGSLKEAATEGGQEAISIGGEQLSDIAIGEEKFKTKLFSTDAAKRIFENAALGAIGGGSAIAIGKMTLGSKQMYDKAQEAVKNPEFASKIPKILEAEVLSGEITPEQAEVAKQNISTMIEVDTTIPDIVTDDEKRLEATNLILQKKDLETKDKAMAAPIMKAIDEELAKISSESAGLESDIDKKNREKAESDLVKKYGTTEAKVKLMDINSRIKPVEGDKERIKREVKNTIDQYEKAEDKKEFVSDMDKEVDGILKEFEDGDLSNQGMIPVYLEFYKQVNDVGGFNEKLTELGYSDQEIGNMTLDDVKNNIEKEIAANPEAVSKEGEKTNTNSNETNKKSNSSEKSKDSSKNSSVETEIVSKKEVVEPTEEKGGEINKPPASSEKLTEKQQALKELDEARVAFRKASSGLSIGGQLQAIPAFINVVKAAIKAGYLTAKDFIKDFKDDFEGYKEKEIEDAFDAIKVGEEKKPIRKTKEQKKIEQTTGVKQDTTKITVKEKTALKDQLKSEVKAAKQGFKEGVKVEKEKARVKKEADIRDKEKKGLITIKEGDALRVKLRAEEKASKEGFKEGKKESAYLSDKIIDFVTKQFKGKISTKQFDTIVKRALSVKTPNDVQKFYDYATKVIDNENYKQDLSDANTVRGKIKTANKGKNIAANNKAVVGEFAKLNPDEVSSLKDYQELADKIKEQQKGLRFTSGEPIEMKGEDYKVSNEEISKYIEEQKAFQEEVQKNQLKEDYQDLVDEGLIDPETMSSKEMQDIIDATKSDEDIDSLLDAIPDSDKGRKLKAIQAYVDYKIMGLDGIDRTDLSPREKGVLDHLNKIDTETLDAKDLLKINDVINNIVTNNDFSGAGEIESISGGQEALREIGAAQQKNGMNLGDISNKFISYLSGKSVLFEFVAKSSKAAADMQHFLGISGIFDGHAKVKNMQSSFVDGMIDLKKGSKDIDTPINKVRRGVYAHVLQDFNTYKDLINKSAERLLKSSVEYEKELGSLYAQAYAELLDGSNNAKDVKSKMDKFNNRNSKIVSYVVDIYKSREDKTSESARMDNNIDWQSEEHYTPTKPIGVDGMSNIERKTAEDLFKRSYFGNGLKGKQAGTKFARKKTLNKNQALDLDFDKVSTEKYYETNYDVETTANINKLRWILSQQEANTVLGGAKNKKIFTEFVKSSINTQRGTTPPEGREAKAVQKTINILQAKGARIALLGVGQLIKQYPSVMVKTLGTLGKDAPLYIKALMVSSDIPLFKEYNISSRGDVKGGFNKDNIIKQIEKIDFKDNIQEGISQLQKYGEFLGDKISWALISADKSVAKTSWLAHYMKDLRDQGIDIDNIDWSKHHLEKNNRSAAYAEQVTSKTQSESNPTALAKMYHETSSTWGNIVRNSAMPFNSFALNMRMSMTSDLNKIINGGAKKEAYTSLASTMAEQLVFNAIKTYIIANITTYTANSVASAFGLHDDDTEEQKKYAAEKEKNKLSNDAEKVISNTMSDYTFGGTGVLQKQLFEPAINAAYKMGGGKKDIFYKFDPAKYGDPNFGVWGAASAALSTGTHVAKVSKYAMGNVTKTTKGGLEPEYKEVELTDKERHLAQLLFMVDAAALAGLSDSEVSMANNKLRKMFIDKMAQRYEGRKIEVQGTPKKSEKEQIQEIFDNRLHPKLETPKEKMEARKKKQVKESDLRNKAQEFGIKYIPPRK